MYKTLFNVLLSFIVYKQRNEKFRNNNHHHYTNTHTEFIETQENSGKFNDINTTRDTLMVIIITTFFVFISKQEVLLQQENFMA